MATGTIAPVAAAAAIHPRTGDGGYFALAPAPTGAGAKPADTQPAGAPRSASTNLDAADDVVASAAFARRARDADRASPKVAADTAAHPAGRLPWLDKYCYRPGTVYDFPFTFKDRLGSSTPFNTPDCRSTGHGPRAAEDATTTPKGQRYETAYKRAFQRNLLLDQNPAQAGRRAWPLTDSYGATFAWLEQRRPDPSSAGADVFAVYDASGVLTDDHLIGDTGANGAPTTATVAKTLQIQGRACEATDAAERSHVLVAVFNADYGTGPHAYADPANGPGPVYLGIRGFLDDRAFASRVGIGHYKNMPITDIVDDFDVGCTQHQLGGVRSPATPIVTGNILPTTGGLSPLFETDDHYQGEAGHGLGSIGDGNRYSNYNGFPDPNESVYQQVIGGAGPQNASLPRVVKIMANTTGVRGGGIVRAIVPATAAYTEYDHFDYHDPDTVCVNRDSVHLPAQVRFAAQWAFVHITDAPGGRTIQGWVPQRVAIPPADPVQATCSAAQSGQPYPGGEFAAAVATP